MASNGANLLFEQIFNIHKCHVGPHHGKRYNVAVVIAALIIGPALVLSSGGRTAAIRLPAHNCRRVV